MNLIKSKFKEISYIKNQNLTINEFEQSPLHISCLNIRTKLEIIKYLIEEMEFDVNQFDCENFTPFLYACQFIDDPEIFKFLLKQKPNLFLERKVNNSLTLICKYTKNIDILSSIILYMIENKIEYDFRIDQLDDNPINISKKNIQISNVKFQCTNFSK